MVAALRTRTSEWARERSGVYDWQVRLTRLGRLPLAYAFFMQLMGEPGRTARDRLIAEACHRRGQHLPQGEIPFPRKSLALSEFGMTHVWEALCASN
jgi:hypothetical protein